MTSYLPITHCHFCNRFMLCISYGCLYTIYCSGAGENSSCMSLMYEKQNDKFDIQELILGNKDLFLFKASKRNQEGKMQTSLTIHIGSEPITNYHNNIMVDLDSAVNKQAMLNLSDKLSKLILMQ